MKKDAAIIGLTGLIVALFLGTFVGTFSNSWGSRIPALPRETRFKVSAAVVELSTQAAVLAGEKPEALLNDIPGRSRIGLDILRLSPSSSMTVRASKSSVLRQGGAFDLSFTKAASDATGPALKSVKAHLSLNTVDRDFLAETNVSGFAQWRTDPAHEAGASIVGYDCFVVGGANMVPLYLSPDRSAWIVVSVEKLGS